MCVGARWSWRGASFHYDPDPACWSELTRGADLWPGALGGQELIGCGCIIRVDHRIVELIFKRTGVERRTLTAATIHYAALSGLCLEWQDNWQASAPK